MVNVFTKKLSDSINSLITLCFLTPDSFFPVLLFLLPSPPSHPSFPSCFLQVLTNVHCVRSDIYALQIPSAAVTNQQGLKTRRHIYGICSSGVGSANDAASRAGLHLFWSLYEGCSLACSRFQSLPWLMASSSIFKADKVAILNPSLLCTLFISTCLTLFSLCFLLSAWLWLYWTQMYNPG